MKKLLTALLLLLCYGPIHAQRENVWIFGISAGLDFNQGNPPVSILSKSNDNNGIGNAACASVCDASGKLLFYTEGDIVRDKNHNKMPNGRYLTGLNPIRMTNVLINGQYVSIVDSNFSNTSANAQGALIVPFPDDTNKYYIFSLRNSASGLRYIEPHSGKLYYSVVDMRLNGGLGDVVPGEKGISVDSVSMFPQFMTAVVGDNCNVWVVVTDHPDMGDSMEVFRAFEVNHRGVNQTPVISKPALSLFRALDTADYNAASGHMCFSPDRKKLAMGVRAISSFKGVRVQDVMGFLYLYDFDPAAGKISNRRNLYSARAKRDDSLTFYRGVCFSPNSQMLYANAVPQREIDSSTGGIFQYDLSSNSLTSIIASKTLIDNLNRPVQFYNVQTDLKLGPDNKVYYHSGITAPFSWNYWYGAIGRIDFPNLKGMACQPDAYVSSLNDALISPNGDTTYAQSTPNFPNVVPVIKPDTAYATMDTIVCPITQKIGVLRASQSNTYRWDDGSSDSMRAITSSGTYWVLTKDVCHYYIDTIHLTILDMDPVINVDSFKLSTTASYETYQWLLNGRLILDATASTYTVLENGDYQVIVSNELGCTDTSAIYTVTNVTGINTIQMSAGQITIYPNPTNNIIHINAQEAVNLSLCSIEGKILKKEKKSNQIALQGLSEGIYFLKIYDRDGKLLKIEKIIKTL